MKESSNVLKTDSAGPELKLTILRLKPENLWLLKLMLLHYNSEKVEMSQLTYQMFLNRHVL